MKLLNERKWGKVSRSELMFIIDGINWLKKSVNNSESMSFIKDVDEYLKFIQPAIKLRSLQDRNVSEVEEEIRKFKNELNPSKPFFLFWF